MNPQVGDKIKFICNYERITKTGNVLRILEEITGSRKRLLLVKTHGLLGSKQWVQPHRILKVMNYEKS